MKNPICTMSRVAATACFVAIAGLAVTLTAQTSDAALSSAEAQAREAWRATMHQTSAPWAGCFHASYPSTLWEPVECAAPPGYRSALPKVANREQVAGNGFDFVAEAPSGHLFSSVVGSFPTVTGVKTEKSVGVPLFGDSGILGTNEYTLQVNTNFFHSAACGSFTNCIAWQQYVMSTNTPVSLTSGSLTDKTEVFIEYWLIDYGKHNGADICPSGFLDAGEDEEGPGDDCIQNTPAAAIANGQLPITDLDDLELSASATPNATDAATVTFDGDAFTATVEDSLTDIASGWSMAEFNVLGNAGGSRADFNTSGVSITAKIAVSDGSTTAPTCVSPSSEEGTTGETNNLTLGSCTATGGSAPSIQFTESN
ncbi:MAG: hypothetical protein ABSD59_00885 [Terracidiphilus sp.]